MDIKRYRIEYHIQGVMTFMPFYIVLQAYSLNDLDAFSDDDIKELIMKKDKIAKLKGKGAITLCR